MSFARQAGGRRWRARSSRQHSAPGGEPPRSCVAGAGRTEVSSVRRKRAENFGGSFGRAGECADNDRDGHHRAATPRRRSIGSRRRRMGLGASSRSSSRNHDGGDGAPVPAAQAGSVETLPGPALEASDRLPELGKESACPVQWTQLRRKRKEQRQRKRKRRQSDENRASRK